jgi:hypothetical protein
MLDTNSKSKNVLVTGTARNCAKYIKSNISKLQSSLKVFNQVHWLIIESDSKDNTVSELNGLTSDIANFRFISLGMLSKEYPLRTERIAFCRNIYIKELRENPLYKEIDFIVITDLDCVNPLISQKAISSCFVRDDWDVCTANQNGHYYDIWALRHKIWCPNDCWQQVDFFKLYGLNSNKAKFSGVYSKMLIIPQDTPWIEVDSAFGGLAIYHRRTLEKAQYIGITEEGTKICEHVTLHQQIKDQGFNIFINPALINEGHNEHARCFIFSKRIRMEVKRIRREVKGIRREVKRVIKRLVKVLLDKSIFKE